MMSELIPCPMCNGPLFIETFVGRKPYPRYVARCEDDEGCGWIEAPDKLKKTKQEVINIWGVK